MSVITNKWNDGSGDSISIESPSFQGNQTVKISSPVQKGTSKRSMRFIGKCQKDPSKQVVLVVEQEASVYTYDLILSSDNTKIAAKGGTATITASCSRSKTPVYTSGSTGTATSESATPTLALTTNPGGFTLSGNKLTAANNPIGAKTATVTASYSGATSKSVTITQSAGPDGIGYMQIQGNGVDHYIFQIGRTPNTRSNDVQTLSESSIEVGIEDSIEATGETKSESLFTKIKNFIVKFK